MLISFWAVRVRTLAATSVWGQPLFRTNNLSMAGRPRTLCVYLSHSSFNFYYYYYYGLLEMLGVKRKPLLLAYLISVPTQRHSSVSIRIRDGYTYFSVSFIRGLFIRSLTYLFVTFPPLSLQGRNWPYHIEGFPNKLASLITCLRSILGSWKVIHLGAEHSVGKEDDQTGRESV